MVTIMIVSQKKMTNENLAASIIGGVDGAVNIIAVTDTAEAEQIIISEKYDIDLFIFQVKMKPKSGTILEVILRKQKKYEEKPVLLLTDLSYNLVGYPMLAGYEAYKHKNYISMPIERIDVQAKLSLYIDEILKEQNVKAGNYIYLEHSKGDIVINRKDILFAEVQNKVLTVHCIDGAFEIKGMTLQKFCEQVGLETLIRCHKSYAINVESILEFVREDRRNWNAIFDNGSCCPISQTYYDKIRLKYICSKTR